MTAYPVDWVDAFTDRRFCGNPCAVVHDADGLAEADRIALVAETRLSECAYVVASDKADFGARYYLATREILMAGHPTVATVVSLLSRGLVSLDGGRAAFTLEVGAGVLAIEVEERDGRPVVTMTQVAPTFGARHDPAEVAAIYGLGAADVVGSPRWVSTGTAFIVTCLASRQALEAAVLDAPRLADFAERNGYGIGPLMEPYLCILEGATEAGDTFARLLLPPPLPPEDPFTGSATGCMASYLWSEGLIAQPSFVHEQGHLMGRPGRAEVEVLGPREAPTGVRVGGSGVLLMSGTVEI